MIAAQSEVQVDNEEVRVPRAARPGITSTEWTM